MHTRSTVFSHLELHTRSDSNTRNRAALKHHPDRVPADSPERPRRTKKFQEINDAYYTLSDTTRRRDFDSLRQQSGFTSSNSGGFTSTDDFKDHTQQQSSGGGFKFPFGFPNPFGGASTTGAENTQRADEQFSSVFEEMLREEGMAEGAPASTNGKFWSMIGSVSGGAMGFIVGSVPGAVAGVVAGGKLGAVRDKHHESVYAVFQKLPQGDKARLLSQLAARFLSQGISI